LDNHINLTIGIFMAQNTTTEAEMQAKVRAANPVQLRIVHPSLADLPQGAWFRFAEDRDDMVYIACNNATDGRRWVVIPTGGQLIEAKAHAPCVPFGGVDIVLRPRI
jgi:hypothetical protein